MTKIIAELYETNTKAVFKFRFTGGIGIVEGAIAKFTDGGVLVCTVLDKESFVPLDQLISISI